MKCRHCEAPLEHGVVDLGHQPPSNAYLSAADLERAEVYAPLKVFVCSSCWLVQLPAHHAADAHFGADYAYFSSVSSSWVAHAEAYMEAMTERFGLAGDSFVVEVASNDGYLLQFAHARGIRCLGIEPTASTAASARQKGIESLEEFFGEALGGKLATERGPADLMAANNVLAHVPDIDDFVAGFREMLAPEGVATFEFPHLMKLVDGDQFDTIYHEHYSYLSLVTVDRIFESRGLRVFDVEELPTHGGSLRVFACRQDAAMHQRTDRVDQLIATEIAAGLQTLSYYQRLQPQADGVKLELLAFLVEQRKAARNIAAYGAAAKGNTLLNYAGVKPDLVEYVCDSAPSKQGRFLPGSHIPVLAPEALKERRPDFVLILPWNIRAEIEAQHSYIAEWGGKFVVAVPRLEVL